MTTPRVDDRDWSVLTLGERIRQIEVEGYLVLPDLLRTDQVRRLKTQTATLETSAVDYSIHQRYRQNLQFSGGAITELAAHPPAISFLETLLGKELIIMSYSYARSEPGHPGISLHTDGKPYGSNVDGYEGSVPIMVRALYYLDDLTPDVSPFRVVPRSHLCLHADANPYITLDAHPEEVMVPVKAGSAMLINHRVFHGNYPNTGDRAREMLAIAYRPGWGGTHPGGDSLGSGRSSQASGKGAALFRGPQQGSLEFSYRKQARQHGPRSTWHESQSLVAVLTSGALEERRADVNSKRIRVGIISEPMSISHLEYCFNALANCEGIDRIAIADASGEAFEEGGALLGRYSGDLCTFRSASEMLEAFKPELVFVSLEAHHAPGPIEAALEAGCHVVSEKPACVRTRDFEHLVEVAKRKQRHLMLVFANRLLPQVQKAKELIQSGSLGDFYGTEIHTIADQTRLKSPEYQNSWYASKGRRVAAILPGSAFTISI